MKLLAGLVAPSPAWEAILSQEGLPWMHLPSQEEWFDMCSVLIVTRRLEGRDRDHATHFLQRGGAVLGSAQHFNGLARMSSRPVHLRYIVSEGDPLFASVRLIDLAMPGHIPREANHLRTDGNEHAVFAGELGGGIGVVLPFDMQAAVADARVTSKAFYCHRERLPSERVSLVARGEIRHLVRSALTWLHNMRGFPYAHLWYFPGDAHSVATLRVDTDGAPRDDIDALHRIMQDAGVRGTWFLDVQAHETWLPHFHALAGQEIGLHCYEHRFGSDVKADEANIRRGNDLLRAAGWTVAGFAAPFGTWTPAYGALIDRMGFAYSSEFGCGYDTLPFLPERHAATSTTLQVPIHPISIGSLLRTGASGRSMKQYFEDTAADLVSRQMPLFFYHHPTHRHWDVVHAMVSTYQDPGIMKLTLGEYARWWQQRALLDVAIEVAGHHIMVRNGDLANAADVFLHIIRPDGQEALVSPAQPITLTTLHCERSRQSVVPADLRRIREVDPRRMLGELYSAMLRRLK